MFRIRLLIVVIVVFNTAVFGSPISTGEKGGRSHRTRLAAGGGHACALLDDGTVQCWDAVLSGVVQISAGTGFVRNLIRNFLVPVEHTCALLATGVIDCWGSNSSGEIGDGTTTQRPRPTAVNSFLANVDPAATLHNNRVAEVTALIDCETGDEAHLILNLAQDAAKGTGDAEAHCDG